MRIVPVTQTGTLVLLMLALGPVAALAKPSVSLTIPDADAGKPISYSYRSSGVPRSARLVIQRAMGTARHFQTIATLKRNRSGSSTLGALKLGRYSFRIAAVAKNRALAQRKVSARVFGTVTFANYLRVTEGTLTLPTRTFTYAFGGYPYGNGIHANNDFETVLSVSASKNTCRSVHVDWVPQDDSGKHDTVGELAVVHESSDATTDTAVDQEISAIDSQLSPGQSWGINFRTVTPQRGMVEAVNGTLNCYTTSRAS